MNLKRLAYYYLPAISISLCLIAIGIDLYVGHPIQTAAFIIIPIMAFLIFWGWKKGI